MPVLGYDMVVKCRVCLDTARVRVLSGHDPGKQANPYRMMAELHDQGFELDPDGEYLCHRHGRNRDWPVGPPGLRLVKETEHGPEPK